MLGSCRNGNESDKGFRIHAVEGWAALCGKEPGHRSAGWQLYPDRVLPLSQVTCPRCKARLIKSGLVIPAGNASVMQVSA
jgi:hypothetical protein